MSETVEGKAVSSLVRTWLAPGVGPVRSEVIIRAVGKGRGGSRVPGGAP